MHKTKERIADEKAGRRPVSQLGPPRIQKPMSPKKACWTEVVTNPAKYCKNSLF